MADEFDLSLLNNGQKLPLIEEFYTLQGEGFHTGKAAYFIRIGGCDICCSWCDSKISWKTDVHKLVAVSEVAEKAASYPAKAVVVTGGEPSIFELTELCNEMKTRGVSTFLETAGSYQITGEWDWICLSPKKQKPPVDSSYTKAHELKVIVYSNDDFLWAEQCAAKVLKHCKLYLQPEWSRYKKMIPEIVEYIKQNPQWCISLQAHKFMKIP